jgi:6-phosphogluconolactonase (cycloisomerase 2 family)
MSFLRAARAARVCQSCSGLILATIVLAGLSLSCGNSSRPNTTGPNHNAYVSLPAHGSVLLLHIDGKTGVITVGAETPRTENTTPTALALLPSKKFLYAINSFSNSISIFNVASDGTLTLTQTPTPVSVGGPNAAVIDPSGKYLLVTNDPGGNRPGSISVFSIDAGSGALSQVGTPVSAGTGLTSILITPSGKFVYVTNSSIGAVTGFAFANGVLTESPQSPFFSGTGAVALAVDSSEQFLYVTNPQATNPFVSTLGNISGFNIDSNTGDLTQVVGSPFTSATGPVGIGPTSIAVDFTGKFVYAITTGSSASVWCFSINPANGELTAVTSSPFSLNAGGLFALFDPLGNYLFVGGATGVSGFTYNPSTGVPTVVSGSPFSTAGTTPGTMVLSE